MIIRVMKNYTAKKRGSSLDADLQDVPLSERVRYRTVDKVCVYTCLRWDAYNISWGDTQEADYAGCLSGERKAFVPIPLHSF